MTQQPGQPATSQHPVRFKVRQRLTLMVNRYEIHGVDDAGVETRLWALAEQKRMAFKEQVIFYADAEKSRPVFGFKARSVMDLGATYDVTDADGRPIGWFKKEFARSLTRSTWLLGSPTVQATGAERNAKIAVLRRVWDLIPIVGEIPVPFLFHFDFVTADGQHVMSSVKRPSLKDVYEITVSPTSAGVLDWRVAAAMAVALDALQSR
jgi:uncharacterized protein YxjI